MMFRSGLVHSALAAVLAVAAGAGCGREAGEPEDRRIRVVRILPQERLFQERIRVQGNVEAKELAVVCARTDGAIDLMPVDEGCLVKRGDILFQVDKLNLENQLEVARHELKVAETRVKEADGRLAIAEATNEKAELDYKRGEKLIKINAIAMDEFERHKLNWRQAELNIRLAEAGQATANVQVAQALNNVDIAKKYLDDSIIRAPFDAVVTHRYKEPGEYAKKAESIVRLENQDKLEISLLISAKNYGRVEAGVTKAVIRASDSGTVDETVVAYKSPSVEASTRTFEIKIDLPEDGGFVTGMLCEIDLILREETGYGVPGDAIIQMRGGEHIVFTTRDAGGRLLAAAVPVTPGISDGGVTELEGVTAANRFPVIVQGQSFLNPGAMVELVPMTRPEGPADGTAAGT